ncbi:glyoxalase [Nocardiopsis kunsanensis]|uniref:Glyoxalase n=1 Tax=Nocardiopsis kunsanensis TaxID=141693 RepID=A0A918X8T6_9ACTN|nr:VOC family protein [Nocardiopsis kunsanensis]GHD17763.1 glyoxalase [Nocardiopsis kunsanensis]
MDVLSSRLLIRPIDPERSRVFYRDVLGLAVQREFGDPESPGTVFFLGNGSLEVSGSPGTDAPSGMVLWMQVRDVHAEYQRLVERGAEGLREPQEEFWGLIEGWIADPDGIRIVLVQIPEGHPLRRDQRTF